MTVKERIDNFVELGFGMFVHFGLYSVVGGGEWFYYQPWADKEAYFRDLPARFKVKKTWAKELVSTAKKAGCKYIVLTTRHHDGFSLYDTCGLNDFDAPHSASGRDLVREFVDACNGAGIVPFFYHTLLDWYNPDYTTNFPKYIDYLVDSLEILCKNYGKIGGFWFDGMWNKKDADWQEDRIYGTLRKYQPDAMIINNTGLGALGKVGHPEIDSVTFERGTVTPVDDFDRPRAGEKCAVLNQHWGYAKEDCNYKSVREILEMLVECRRYSCNLLLNVGPRGNGSLRTIDRGIFEEIGNWTKDYGEFVYHSKPCDIPVEGAELFKGKDGYHYAVLHDVSMQADPNVQRLGKDPLAVKVGATIESATWLDDGKEIAVTDGNSFRGVPYLYGRDKVIRIAKLKLKA